MTPASAGSPKGQDPERGLIAEGDNIAVGVADAPNPCFTTPNPILEGVELREAYARVREALDDLQRKEAKYRAEHDLHGDGSIIAGRAWNHMRRAGDIAREALKATPLIGLSQREGDEAHDWVTHRRAWRDGLVLARDFACEGSEDPEADRMYWQHEIDVFDRTFAALSTVQDGSVREALDALEEARGLIQEAKGHDGPNGGFITNHLDFAESWIGVAEAALSTLPQSPAPISGDAS